MNHQIISAIGFLSMGVFIVGAFVFIACAVSFVIRYFVAFPNILIPGGIMLAIAIFSLIFFCFIGWLLGCEAGILVCWVIGAIVSGIYVGVGTSHDSILDQYLPKYY